MKKALPKKIRIPTLYTISTMPLGIPRAGYATSIAAIEKAKTMRDSPATTKSMALFIAHPFI
ncbi:hypothetical protein HOF56_00085 [Candidatus Peribacteria bacterium]|nr:hypothetical protein [Candidatus Peribacteria bacterium]MBT4021291.1 hypothetical protein [Candidatus Peribacteria bacterium]MBT4240336.1 hypothetical protein [Candidatus Peribacteria bacterium]MBT4474067.1 hypothetical protein [Candidatus Peribacteria bacterium]